MAFLYVWAVRLNNKGIHLQQAYKPKTEEPEREREDAEPRKKETATKPN